MTALIDDSCSTAAPLLDGPGGHRARVMVAFLLAAMARETLGHQRGCDPCGGAIRAAEREQWDDGTNYLAVSPGVILGYDRNNATNTMLRKHGIEVIEVPAANSAVGAVAPVHDLSNRARPGLAT